MFRGHLARQVALERRRELTAFVRMLRKQEERELREEYYRQNPIENFKRRVNQFFQARFAFKQDYDRRSSRPTAIDGDARADEDLADSDDDITSGPAAVDVERLGNDSRYFRARRLESPFVLGKGPAHKGFHVGGPYREVAERLMTKLKRQRIAAAAAAQGDSERSMDDAHATSLDDLGRSGPPAATASGSEPSASASSSSATAAARPRGRGT